MSVPKDVAKYIDGLMGRSPKTKSNYDSFTRGFFSFVNKSIQQVTVDDVVAYLNDGLKKGWKTSTMLQYAGYCHALLYEFRDDTFMKQLKKRLRTLPKEQNHASLYEGLYVPPDKIDRFISTAEDEEWAVLWTIILKWGLRLNEALTISPNDINVDKSRVTIRGKGLGGMNKLRQVFVEKSTITRVLQFAGCSQEQINGDKPIRDNEPVIKNVKARNAEYKWKESARLTGLKNWSKLTPHDGRHSYAIDFLTKRKKQGMAALVLLKNQLGHTNINITSIYLDIAGGEAQDVFDAGLQDGSDKL